MHNPLYRNDLSTPGNMTTDGEVKISFDSTVLSVDDSTKSMEQEPFDLYRYRLRRFIESIGFRLTIAILFISDLIIIIASIILDQTKKSDSNTPDIVYGLDVVSLVLSIIFMLDIALRMIAQGKEFFHKKMEILDLVVMTAGLIVNIVIVATFDGQSDQKKQAAKIIILPRLFRVVGLIRTIRIIRHRDHLKTGSRHLVGQNKKRTIGNGFDLDLCVISDRIIAMSFPSKGRDAFFRNDIVDVGHYLDITYGDHYRVYNLCSERFYKTKYFHDRVLRITIDDHNVPRLNDMIRMGDSVTEWFEQDEKNVIAVHCKGGKGRTGTMICVALLKTGICQTATEALKLFAENRTDLRHGSTYQGVETPSQTRYVGYYEKILHVYNHQMPPTKVFKLKSIVITAIATVGNGDGSDLYFTVGNYDGLLGKFQLTLSNQTDMNLCAKEHSQAEDKITISNIQLPPLKGDVKIMFFSTNKKVPNNYDNCAFYFWFNTSFIDTNSLLIPRNELDNPHKSKTWYIFREKFSVLLLFDD